MKSMLKLAAALLLTTASIMPAHAARKKTHANARLVC